MPSIDTLHIGLNGLTTVEIADLTASLKTVDSVVSVKTSGRTLDAPIQIQASGYPVASLVVAFVVGNFTPGMQEFTKAVGQKNRRCCRRRSGGLV